MNYPERLPKNNTKPIKVEKLEPWMVPITDFIDRYGKNKAFTSSFSNKGCWQYRVPSFLYNKRRYIPKDWFLEVINKPEAEHNFRIDVDNFLDWLLENNYKKEFRRRLNCSFSHLRGKDGIVHLHMAKKLIVKFRGEVRLYEEWIEREESFWSEVDKQKRRKRC